MDLKEILHSYLECALWAETDPYTKEPLDNYCIDDISQKSKDFVLRDIESFLKRSKHLLSKSINGVLIDEKFIGHNLWLTSRGHGVGFWDHGIGSTGDKLTELAEEIMDCHIYAENGVVYID